MDLAGEGKQLPLDYLLKLHANKTGALITVAAELGCIAAGLSPEDGRTLQACSYAQALGLAFQIVDDVLDVISDTETLGKSVGSDAKCEKTTFLSFYSVEEALAYAAELTSRGAEAIAHLDGSDFLVGLADYLLNRKY